MPKAHATQESHFSAASAQTYDQRIPTLIPGYQALQEIVAPMLSVLLPDQATVLVCGAGTGKELVALAQANPAWTLTAIDPSDEMLAIARERVHQAGLEERVTFQACRLQEFQSEGLYDAAVSLLVAHFVPTGDEKALFFKVLGERLKQGGYLLLADLTQWSVVPGMTAYKAWVIAGGKTGQDMESMFERIAANFHPIDDAQLAELLGGAGFGPAQRFFQMLEYQGYLAQRL